jgi:DNA topoisomerase-1
VVARGELAWVRRILFLVWWQVAKATRTEGGKKLVIVESPAKAKTINKYLGPGFEVRASMGHVRDLPEKGIGVDIEHDFAPTYEILASRKKLIGELRTAARASSEVFLATDLDREGEAIAWHLSHALNLDAATTKRVVFNEITKAAIQAAFNSPRLIDQQKVDAQQARRILDRLVGYKISPLLWKKVARGLSAGRVQSVATRLVVDREREILAFMPEEYWKLVGVFTANVTGAGDLAEQWRSFLGGEEEQADDGSDSAAAASGPTQAEKIEWMRENNAFRADLVEFSGKKYDPKDAATSRAAADAVGLINVQVTTVANDGSNGPRGIPNKGPATQITTISGAVDAVNGKTIFAIRSLNTKTSTSRPPGPFSTSTLQQAASNALGFGAQRTMRVAQQLYEGVDIGGEVGTVGLITYMRTDSQNISKDALGMVRGYIGGTFGEKYLPESPNFFASKAGAQEAHEAIRPTDVNLTPQRVRGALSDEQFKLYELIWKRFVACQMTPAQWLTTEALIDATPRKSLESRVLSPEQMQASGPQSLKTQDSKLTPIATFRATGRTLAFDGFTRVAGVYSRDEQLLPKLAERQPVAPLDLTPTQHFTSPPSRYSEASLVKALEAEGIGRPSTYASIISTIQDRQYVESRNRSLFATDLGMKVTDKLIEGFPDLMETGFTRKIEGELDEIEEHGKEWATVVHDFYDPLERDLATAEDRMTHARAEAQPSEYKCADCQAPMVYRLSKRGKRFLSCSRYPDCKGAMNVDREGKPQALDITDYKCPTCAKPMIRRTGRFGPFFGCSGYPECKTLQQADRKTGEPLPVKPPPEDTGLLCPKCGKKNIVIRQGGKRGPFMSCSGFPKCRLILQADRLGEFKAALAEGKGWPADIIAKVGGKVADAQPEKEKKPAKKRAPAKPKVAKAKAVKPAETVADAALAKVPV